MESEHELGKCTMSMSGKLNAEPGVWVFSLSFKHRSLGDTQQSFYLQNISSSGACHVTLRPRPAAEPAGVLSLSVTPGRGRGRPGPGAAAPAGIVPRAGKFKCELQLTTSNFNALVTRCGLALPGAPCWPGRALIVTLA